MSDIEKVQDILKRIDNGWNSGLIFEVERLLGGLVEGYDDIHNANYEKEHGDDFN
jgi:hypothetical protein